MDINARSYTAIGIGAVAALMAVHIGDSSRIPVLVLIAGVVLWSLREPAAGLLAALPLLYMLHPTPTELSWRELGFATVLAVSGSAALIRARNLLIPMLRNIRVPAFLATIWLALNFATALNHGVKPAEWLRGALPFLFLLYGIPVWFQAKTYDDFARLWRFSVGITAALFAWHVIQVYISEELWVPHTYIFEQGQWTQMAREEAERLGKPVYEYTLRVTLLLQQATSVLLPLGAIWGGWAMLMQQKRVERGLGLALAVLSTIAMVLTYTRSMLLVAGLVNGGLMLLAWRRRELLRAIALAAALGSSAGATILVFNLESIYLNRIYMMAQETKAMAQETKAMTVRDANITSRIEEYKIAWNMFSDSPIVGQGLGVKHAISFETSQGEFLEMRVGYVHNWIMYMLMVGGLTGILMYSAMLFVPAYLSWKQIADRQLAILAIVTVVGMTAYALFFAAFRLIPFNLVLGGLWGLVLANAHSQMGRTKTCVA